MVVGRPVETGRPFCVRVRRAGAKAARRAGDYNRRMDYQLVIKFWRKSLESEAFLETVEAELKQALGATVELEGYDVSRKENNLFVLTADPRVTLRKARDVLERLGVERGLSAAYRLVGGAQFTSVWPLRNTRKFTLP